MPIAPLEKEGGKIIPAQEIAPETFEGGLRQESRAEGAEKIEPARPESSLGQEPAIAMETQEPQPETKDEILMEIEKILSSELITKIYNELPSRSSMGNVKKGALFKEDFLEKGADAAQTIHELYQKNEITIETLGKAVREWLSMLPEMRENDASLEQEEVDIIRELNEYFQKLLQKQIE